MHEEYSSSSSLSPRLDESVPTCDNKSREYHNEDVHVKLILKEPPDVIFVVDEVQFPCHQKLLSNRCPILYDILLINGVQQMIPKKYRASPQIKTKEEEKSTLSTMITISELRDVEIDIFRALLEYLYTNELPEVFYWGDRPDDNLFSSGKDYLEDCDPCYEQCREQSIYDAMGFLQKLLIAADRFHMVTLKHEIEYKIYDEFLYSFTAIELFVWADSHSCALLKEKAMDRLCRKSASFDNFNISKSQWNMIRESKRLLEELFLYARYGCYTIHYDKYEHYATDTRNNEQYYYKI